MCRRHYNAAVRATPEGRAKSRADCNRYYHTHRDEVAERGKQPEVKARRKAYNSSEARHAAQKEQRKLPSRKMSQAKYSSSPKGRENRRRYLQTEKGLATSRRHSLLRIAMKKAAAIDDSYKLFTYDGKCFWCGVEVDTSLKRNDPRKPHCDHFIPLSKGGTHSLDNMVTSCLKCNVTRRDTDPYTFAARLFWKELLIIKEKENATISE